MRLEQIWQDLRHGFHLFVKAPGFTAIAVLSIACGTGANVAMFSTADALLLRPLPIRDANALVTIGTPVTDGPATCAAMSYPDFADLRRDSRSFRADE